MVDKLKLKNRPIDISDWEKIELHELCSAFPEMRDEEYEELVTSMREQGFLQSDPIILIGDGDDDKWFILDGQNRRQAAIDAEVEPEFVEYRGDSPASFVMARNMNRRHLSAGQKAAIASKFATMKQGDNQFRDEPVMSQKEAAKTVGVGEASIRRFKKLEKDDPEMAAAVAAGDVSLEEGRKKAVPIVEIDAAEIEARMVASVDQQIDSGTETGRFKPFSPNKLMEKYDIYGDPTYHAIAEAFELGKNANRND